MSSKPDIQRVVILLDREEHRQMQSILALTGTSFSAWVREQMRGVLECREPKKKGKP